MCRKALTYVVSTLMVVGGRGHATTGSLHDERDDVLGARQSEAQASTAMSRRTEEQKIIVYHRGLNRLYEGPRRRTRRPIMTKLAASRGVGAMIVVTILRPLISKA